MVSLTALLVATCDGEDESESKLYARACGDNGTLAYSIVKKYLQAEVKSGTKAAFPALSSIRAEKPSSQEPCLWVIYGHVDLESTEGNRVRRQYIASILYEGENRWRLNDLDLK